MQLKTKITMSEKKSPFLTVKSDLFLKENFQLLEPNCTDDVDLDHDSVDIFQNGFWENIMSKSSPTKPNLPDIHVDSDLTTKSNIIIFVWDASPPQMDVHDLPDCKPYKKTDRPPSVEFFSCDFHYTHCKPVLK